MPSKDMPFSCIYTICDDDVNLRFILYFAGTIDTKTKETIFLLIHTQSIVFEKYYHGIIFELLRQKYFDYNCMKKLLILWSLPYCIDIQ